MIFLLFLMGSFARNTMRVETSGSAFRSVSCRYSLINLLVYLTFFQVSVLNAQITYNAARNGKVIEIRNGNFGIAIPTEKSFTGEELKTLAPFQYFIYQDGQISDTSANYIQIQYPRMGGSGPLSLSLNWLSKSADLCKVEIRYTFRKGKFVLYGKTYPNGDEGPGYYNCLITIRNQDRSVEVVDEFDYEISYKVGVSGGLNPDQMRYRGWMSESVEAGFEKPGQKYRAESDRGYPMDATMNIPFLNSQSYFYLGLWEPAGGEVNYGRYWMAYNSKAKEDANLFGLYFANPDTVFGGSTRSISLLSSIEEKNNSGPLLELSFGLERRGGDDSWYPYRRLSWAVFISSKRDLKEPEKIQPIAAEMNKTSGVADSIDSYYTRKAKLVESFYSAALFGSKDEVQKIIRDAKTDQEYYSYLLRSDDYYKPLFDAWKSVEAEKALVSDLIKYAKALRENYKTGEGVFRDDVRYWKGANSFKLKAITIAGLFANPDSRISPAEKKELESLVAMMARILWDNRNVPLQENSGVNYGTANMPTQYLNSRYFFALLYADDPEFKGRASKILADVRANIRRNIYANGSSFGSPHYTQPAIEPLLFSVLQLKQCGVADLFREEKLLVKFAEFYLTLLTPPSPRFDGNRKIICFGDGSEESAVLFALLASGFRDINPALSQKLLHAYVRGRPRMSLFGPAFLITGKETGSADQLDIGTGNFRGYVSAIRSNQKTTDETALWLLNGDSLFDHRNDDRGELAIYALGAPLSVSRSSFYYPFATDARIRSMVLPASLFKEWDTRNIPLQERSFRPGSWESSSQHAFSKTGRSQSTSADMKNPKGFWRRSLTLLNVWKEKPVILVEDSVQGANEEHIWSMLFYAEGKVATPSGGMEPLKRVHNNSDRQELPEPTRVLALGKGVQRFTFTGQTWNKALQKNGGIDWDVYSMLPAGGAFNLSQWTTTWQNQPEKDEYFKANGKPYEEGQQILRIKAKGNFFTVILPYVKGQPYQQPMATLPNGLMLVRNGADSLVFSNTGFWNSSSDNRIVGCFGTRRFSYGGFVFEGGAAEVEWDGTQLRLRVHGSSGNRKILIPGLQLKKAKEAGNLTLQKVQGGTMITINYQSAGMDLLPSEQGFTEYVLVRG